MPSARKQQAQPFSNYQQFRALLGFLGLSAKAAAVELGVSPVLLGRVASGVLVPDVELIGRIELMSERWPHGLITRAGWPLPLLDRRHAPLLKRSGT